MWEKLEQIARRCAEIGELLTVPEIYGDAKELRRLTQEQKELEPVAQCYEDYRRAERTIAEATELLSDAELRDMAQEELRQAKADKERLYEELRVLLLPRDPNDGKNVIMELRGGVGGEESALFAADLYRMYSMYAEKHGWKIELLNYNDTELGGVKEADFILNGAGAWSRLKFESGVHRVQRVPETESGGRLHRHGGGAAGDGGGRRRPPAGGHRDAGLSLLGRGRTARQQDELRRAADPQADGNRRGVSGGAFAGAEPREVYADACEQAL